MLGADDRLSKAASEIWMAAMQTDPFDEWGFQNDCGPLIERGRRSFERNVLERYGFTPGEFNAEVDARLGHTTHCDFIRGMLHVDACPKCGGPIDSKAFPTHNYGGGFDTVERCLSCGHSEVYV